MGSVKKHIVIYLDEGVDTLGVRLLTEEIHRIFDCGSVSVKLIDSCDVIKGQWVSTTSLFIMPGGRDLPFLKKLTHNGMKNIREFVLNGGSYLGICAGAYFACDSIEFQKGGALEVLGERYLKFYSGKAIGPALADGAYSYESPIKALLAKVGIDEDSVYIYYNGGCLFTEPLPSNSKIIGCYQDLPGSPAAIVSSRVGVGKVVLSGVHFEYPYDYAIKDACISSCVSSREFEDGRVFLIKSIINSLIF